MDTKLWTRVVEAVAWLVAILVAGTIYTGGWDQAAPMIYARWIGTPVPAALTSRTWEYFVLAALAISIAAFYRQTIVEIIASFLSIFYKPPKGPGEPSYTLNLYVLVPRVVHAWVSSGFGHRSDIANRIYDRLQSGDLRAWGRVSIGYPDKSSMPLPIRQPIPARFWTQNTIAELDYWVDHEARWQHGSPELTITMPVRRWFKYRAVRYWDLVFDPSDARKLWPKKNDWMSR